MRNIREQCLLCVSAGFVAVAFVAVVTPAQTWAQAASQPATPPLVGLRTHHALIAECVALLESGQPQAAIDRLRNAARRASHAELLELRLGLGLVLLRSGNVAEARAKLLPLKNLNDHSDLCHRAEVLLGIASRIAKPGTGTQSLLTREAWRAALTVAMDDLGEQMTSQHRQIAAAISGHHWSNVQRALENIHDVQDRAAVFDVEDLRLRQADLITDHARALAAEARDVNVVIADLLQKANGLAGQMAHKHDRSSKRSGYLPADVVAQYNAVIDDATLANAAGERLVTEYGNTVSRSAGRVKRDTSVKMSKTRLPTKRPVWSG